jgi:hypothetical protein
MPLCCWKKILASLWNRKRIRKKDPHGMMPSISLVPDLFLRSHSLLSAVIVFVLFCRGKKPNQKRLTLRWSQPPLPLQSAGELMKKELTLRCQIALQRR